MKSKWKTDGFEFIYVKIFCSLKEIIEKIKYQDRDWEEVFENHTVGNWNTQHRVLKFNKNNSIFKNGQKIRIKSKKACREEKTHMPRGSVLNYYSLKPQWDTITY